jgi:hypothetical protein
MAVESARNYVNKELNYYIIIIIIIIELEFN